jgi:hypothetical protein
MGCDSACAETFEFPPRAALAGGVPPEATAGS